MGTFKLIPRMLALRAVQRQAAASKPASPFNRAQHGVPEGGLPITAWTSPRTSAQTPSLRVSIGQWSLAGAGVTGAGVTGAGVTGAGVTGATGGLVQPQHALQTGDRVMRERMKMVAMSLVLAIELYSIGCW